MGFGRYYVDKKLVREAQDLFDADVYDHEFILAHAYAFMIWWHQNCGADNAYAVLQHLADVIAQYVEPQINWKPPKKPPTLHPRVRVRRPKTNERPR
jgi:hypothetical protein